MIGEVKMISDEILNLKVVKRNGKKVDFDGSKIALAIKKGFDSLIIEDEEPKYSEKDVQKVYKTVIKEIEKNYKGEEKIKIEDIQDLIEKSLVKNKYDDVYKACKYPDIIRNVIKTNELSIESLKQVNDERKKSSIKRIIF